MPAPKPAAIIGSWRHSHEEDSAEARVYRPADFDFPPARGRSGFELAADGSMHEQLVGPVDAPVRASGSWRLDDGVLVLEGAQGKRRFNIVRAGRDRLVLARID